MNTPQWVSQAGNIGNFPQLIAISYAFVALPEKLGNTVQYTLINGSFPLASGPSFSLNTNTGVLTGIPNIVSSVTVYSFTLRATEYDGGQIVGTSDRTFSITVIIPQPNWNTASGSIGTYSDGTIINYSFSATPGTIGNTLKFIKLNGNFPITDNINTPFTLSNNGILSGTAGSVNGNVINSFTIRVIEYSGSNIVSFNDRNFSITIVGSDVPTFITTGPWTFNDSDWVSIPLVYNNPDPNTDIAITLQSGILPNGLELSSNGLLQGYTSIPPSPSTNYLFNLNISNGSANSNTVFSMTVNQTVGNRLPTIYNNRPPQIDTNTLDYSEYYFSGSNMGVYEQGSVLIFKLIGHDFEGETLSYNISGLNALGPTANSVTYDVNTGWISGTLRNDMWPTANTYNISATVYRTSSPLISSNTFNYTITIDGILNSIIEWISDQDLGVINNGEISTKFVEAKSLNNLELEYILDPGSILPAGLTLQTNGEIYGRIPFESLNVQQAKDQETIYTFTVIARSSIYNSILSTKTFTLTTLQRNTIPYDNIYIKAMPSTNQTILFQDLLANTSIIPDSTIYRIDDPYFGKATSLTYNHLYGIVSSSTIDYVKAATINHYKRNITLGELKTARATDSNGNTLYEVIYSEVIDDLINSQGVSISKSIYWPRPIPISGTLQTLYPNSLPNMRLQISNNLTILNDATLLPKWMYSQQKTGSTIGYIQAAVLCYTKPGYADIIKNNINTQWTHKLNDINFQIDRFEIDRSISYEYDSNIELWNPTYDTANNTLVSYLPSAVSTTNDYDSYVFFSENIITDAENTTIPTLELPIVLIYDTSVSAGTTITIPLKGTVTVTIDWGDNSLNNYNIAGNYNHTYSLPGVYTVKISGILTGFGSSTINNSKLVCVTNWGDTGLTDLSNAFYNATNLALCPVNIPSSVINTNSMFFGASLFNSNISAWDVSNIITMNSMFKNTVQFNNNLSQWNVSSVISMNNMFENATIFNQNLSNWCVSNIPTAPTNFSTGSALTIVNLPKWGTCP